MSQEYPAPNSLALLRIADGCALLLFGLLLFFSLWSGFLQIPLLSRLSIPISALPALLWIAGAWRIFRVPPLTPVWRSHSGFFFFAILLQLYLLPYLGWWHPIAPRTYRLLNLALLAFSTGSALILIHLLAREIAQYLKDRVLHVEVYLSAASATLISALMFSILIWSSRRFASDMPWYELLRILYYSEPQARTSIIMLFLPPLLPLIALLWETRQRIRLAVYAADSAKTLP